MHKVYNRILSVSGTSSRQGRRRGLRGALPKSPPGGQIAGPGDQTQEDLVSLQVFAGSRGVSTDDEIRFLGPMKVAFSDPEKPCSAHIRRQRRAQGQRPRNHENLIPFPDRP